MATARVSPQRKQLPDHGIFVDLNPIYHTTSEIAFQKPKISLKETREEFARIRAKRSFLTTGSWFPKKDDDRLSSTYRDSYIPLINNELSPQNYTLSHITTSATPSPISIKSQSPNHGISPATLPPAGKHLTLVLPSGKKGHPVIRKPLPLIVSRFGRAPIALFPRDEVVETALPETPTLSDVMQSEDIGKQRPTEEAETDSQNSDSGGRRARPGSAKLAPLAIPETPSGSSGFHLPSRPKPPQLYISPQRKMASNNTPVIEANVHRRKLGVYGSQGELSAAWKDNIDILTGQVVSRIGNRAVLYSQSETELKRHFPDAGPIYTFTKLPPLAVS
ncbi:hypothetical protein BC829DRAFT_444177 [Chytridium lagenaria]|nr:hypothetical protein BC829DRAFT_444177 [Chytridium lagenaria]